MASAAMYILRTFLNGKWLISLWAFEKELRIEVPDYDACRYYVCNAFCRQASQQGVRRKAAEAWIHGQWIHVRFARAARHNINRKI